MKTKQCLVLFLLFLSSSLLAQTKYEDKLILRTGDTIRCEVREIGDDEIKYAQEGLRVNVLMGIDKNKVAKIFFADGREMAISDSMTQSQDYNLQHKNAIKVNFLLPAAGAWAFSYERSLKPGQSFEVELGIISTGSQDQYEMDASGFFLKTGFKFIRDPDFYLKGMRYAHILKGGYIKPELAFATFDYSNNTNIWGGQSSNESGTTAKLAVLLNIGKQYVFNNWFAIDIYSGIGYILGGGDEDLRYFAFTGAASGLTFSGGIRVGVLF